MRLNLSGHFSSTRDENRATDVPDLASPDTADPARRTYTASLLNALRGADLESAWNERIDDWGGASGEGSVSARRFIESVRDRVVEGLGDTDDAIEFQTAALLGFTRLKAFWFELNSRIGFQFANDNPDTVLLLRAGLVSALLEAIEPHLPPNSVKKVDAFLSAVVADDVEVDTGSGSRLLPGPSDVRKKIVDLLGTIESLSERVVQQEAELISLRSAQESLQKEFGNDTTVAQVAARVRSLSASITGLEAQARMEEIYREVLGQALGTSDPIEVVKEVRLLRDVAKQSESEMGRMRWENERIRARFGEDFSPETALDRLRDAERFTETARTETEALQTRLAAQAGRVSEVVAERDRLLAMIGAEKMEDAETVIRTLHENSEAYAGIAELLGDVGKELGKIRV